MFNNRDFDDVYQDLDIPVPDPILLSTASNNHHEDDEPPPTKRMKRGAAALAEKSSPAGDQPSPVTAGTKVMALPNGMIKTNTPICDIIKVVKPVIRKLVEDCKYKQSK